MASIAVSYLLAGLFLVFVGPAAKGLREERADLARNPAATPTKRALFVLAVSIAIILLWPVLVPSAFRTQAQRKQREAGSLFKLMDAYMSASGTDQDQLENGYGEFGHALTNPIPTRAIRGSIAYLSRLRTMDGEKVRFIRHGSMQSPVSPNPVDAYRLVGPGDKPLGMLYVSPYHQRNSAKAPRGYTLAVVSADRAYPLGQI
jgi:hypothetical protein